MVACLMAIALTASLHTLAAVTPKAPAGQLTFEEHVRPILKANCFECHGEGEKLKGGLDLRLRRFLLRGGEAGPAIVPGEAAKSLLLKQVRAGEMPPRDKKLTAQQIDILTKWIAGGARTGRIEPAELPVGAAEITEQDRAHWAFQPVRSPEIPPTKAKDRVRTPVDAFLVAAMARHKLSFSPDAEKSTVIRRLSLDLTGLPPTPEEVQTYVQDTAPDAYEQLGQRLLASTHYGERWGRHWLDIAGYADSDGYTDADPIRNYAYKYRDYVIRSINGDKPFNQFITEQLAGDELAGGPYPNLSPDKLELLIATGFLRMGADGTGSGAPDPDLAKNNVLADTIKIVSTSLLGLSVGCAQCHDHRYEPITHEDYHHLRAVFEPAYDWKNWRNPNQRLLSLYTAEDRAKAAAVEAEAGQVAAERDRKQKQYIAEALDIELKKFAEPLREKLRAAYQAPDASRTPEQQKLLKENPSVNLSPGVLYQYNQKAADELKAYDPKIAAIRAKKLTEDFVQVLTEMPGKVPTTFLFHRGDHQQPKKPIGPGEIGVISPPGRKVEIPEKDAALPTSGRRLAYAKWLTSDEHPLLSRVIVNRVWLHHFGTGLVGTPANFGVSGEKPSNSELLDWLATEFRRHNWSLKWLHQTIVNSTAYRQSSFRDPKKQKLDPDNRLYWRKSVKRLDAEVIRDSILAVSGSLNPKMFGPPIPVREDAVGQIIVGVETKVDSNQPGQAVPLGGEEYRRSVYIQVLRSKPLAVLNVFDAPVMVVNCESRAASTVAPQALMLMNSEFMLHQADLLAERLRREAGTNATQQVERAWQLAFSRRPTATEQQAATQLLATQHHEILRRHATEHPWTAGYGEYDAVNKRLKGFTPLPHWTGSTWQGGAKLPDERYGYVSLHATGGHPGNPAYSPVRRWVSPVDGVIQVTGTLGHGSPNGDGVRGWILHSRLGSQGEWVAFNKPVATPVERISVQRGDVLDFGVDCQVSETSDSFNWAPVITLQNPVTAQVQEWSAQKQFSGPVNTVDARRRALVNLSQVLLSANELLYVD